MLDEYQLRALAAYDRGENVFITGSAGCGKSAVLRLLIERAYETKFAIMASTNLAALAVGGTTVHSFACLQRDDEPLVDVFARVDKRYMAKRRARIRDARVLFIDEISMVSDRLFERASAVVNYVCRANKRRRSSSSSSSSPELPFAGKQLVVVGDFMQLPPVRKAGERYAFQSPLWAAANFSVVQLACGHRQSGDVRFFELLQRVRLGEHTRADIALLESRLVPPGTDVRAVAVCPLRVAVEQINRRRLLELDARTEQVYVARTLVTAFDGSLPGVESLVPGDAQRSAALRERLARVDVARATNDIISPPTLALRVGARVLLTRSINSALVNGSTGVVVGFTSEYETSALMRLPLVDFDGGNGWMRVDVAEWVVPNEADDWRITYTQVPLLLGWGITTHKSQGMTISRLAVDIGSDVFEPNQAYTALSRGDALEHLYVLKFSERALRACPEALAFYRELNAP